MDNKKQKENKKVQIWSYVKNVCQNIKITEDANQHSDSEKALREITTKSVSHTL